MKRLIWFGCALLWIGCNGETLSVGELRCENTRCELPEYNALLPGSGELEQASEEKGSVSWRAAWPSCPGGKGCAFVSQPVRRGARWVLHPDGSSTIAAPWHDDQRAGILIARYSVDGELLWQNDTLVQERSEVGTAALALEAGGAAVLAVSGLESHSALGVYRIEVDATDTAAELRLLFRTDAGTQPEALAWAGGDLLIAGYHERNPELSRYDLNGELKWRQAVLRPAGDDDPGMIEVLESGMQVAVDADGQVAVLVPSAGNYALAHVDAEGELRAFSWLPPAPPVIQLSAGLVFDHRGRLIVGIDGYTVMSCEVPSCSPIDAERWVATRERQAYYEPELMGLDVDAEDRAYVLTQDGLADERRLLVDRISADFSRRETFVIDEGGERIYASDVRVGPSGDLYYSWFGDLGRIAFE